MTLKSLVRKNAWESFAVCMFTYVLCALLFGSYILVLFGYDGARASREDPGLDYLFAGISLVFMLLLSVWLYKRIMSLVDYKRHPSYKLFERIPGQPGDNERLLDSELAQLNIKSVKHVIKTQSFVIAKRFSRTDISKNPPRQRSY